MDELDELKETVEECAFNRAKGHTNEGHLSLVFYDMTTLYLKQKTKMT